MSGTSNRDEEKFMYSTEVCAGQVMGKSPNQYMEATLTGNKGMWEMHSVNTPVGGFLLRSPEQHPYDLA